MDSTANNYKPVYDSPPTAENPCTYDIPGCILPNAYNYDSQATIGDGSCVFEWNYGCMDSTAIGYLPFHERPCEPGITDCRECVELITGCSECV